MPFSYTEIIDRLCLEPLPLEGGYFKRTYESSQSIDLNKGYEQPLGTCIYFLLTPAAFSALHWLIEDEIYHYYLGDPVALYELSPQKGLSKIILGQNLLSGQAVQHVVNKNCWHGSRLVEGGEWALMGTTMAPGFTWEDFELGIQDKLISEYPEHKTLILELTREQD